MKRDNELRQELGLPLPSYDELCNLKDLPALDSKKSQQVMERLGIFFAKSTDKSTTSAASHKAATSASGSKTVKVQRSWYQEKRSVGLPSCVTFVIFIICFDIYLLS